MPREEAGAGDEREDGAAPNEKAGADAAPAARLPEWKAGACEDAADAAAPEAAPNEKEPYGKLPREEAGAEDGRTGAEAPEPKGAVPVIDAL